ncbi:MAG: hypothetical protein V7711_01445 [Pseudomonadales bacterium]
MDYSANKPLVVALGNSLLSYSVTHKPWLGADVRWQRIVIPGRGWSDHEKLIPRLKEARPELVIIQSGLFGIRRGEQSTDFSVIGFKSALSKWLIVLLQNVFLAESSSCDYREVDRGRVRAENVRVKLLRNLAVGYGQPGPVLSSDALDFLVTLQDLSGSLVVIHLPRSSSLSLAAGEEWLDRLRSELAGLDIDLVEVGGSLPENMYMDGSHVNPKGREVRQRQLRKLVRDRL